MDNKHKNSQNTPSQRKIQRVANWDSKHYRTTKGVNETNGITHRQTGSCSITHGYASALHEQIKTCTSKVQQSISIASTTGVSLNNLSFRTPTHLYRSNASLHGMGGYNISSGNAWRLEIPTQCRLWTSLNSLEFIAALISIWIDSFYNNIEPEACLLSQKDSTSASGWLKKSNFSDSIETSAHLATACKLASNILQSESCLYSQWFPGNKNDVADACSRDFHLPDRELTSMISSFVPQQIPNGFKLREVPQEIILWTTSTLLSQPQQREWNQTPIRSNLSRGSDTSLTSSPSQPHQTHSWMNFHPSNEIKFWEPSLTPYTTEDFISNAQNQSKQNPFDPPLIAWHRPTAWQVDPTQDLTKMENLLFFYNYKSEDTKSPTHQNNSK